MTNETDSPLISLTTLSTQLLGVVAILTQEVARSKAVDVERLQESLRVFFEQETGKDHRADSEKRMIDAVKRVILAATDSGRGGLDE
ncbi:hypothetical protein [Acidovorax sp. Root219]|uniref:hypothetical protein n=1 Tax=Acidovorax sp. Root219 TaxID=1736493 RepID=UPI00070B0BFE|nr:hypothetical protein [Acidovorax sp. Root219]KRC20185.1 hypothetical protein ASE28_28255 [Acidovorax sp. Root219]